MNDLTPAEYEQLKQDAADARRGKPLPPPPANPKTGTTITMGSRIFMWAVAAMICIVAALFNGHRLITVSEQVHVITLIEAVLSIYYFLVFVFWTYLASLCFKKGYND